MIYFIRDELAGAIKVGTASDPVRRLSMLQIGNPRPLQLVGVIPGDAADEARLHRRFRRHRLRGEWFNACPELAAAVKELIEECGVPAPPAGAVDFTHSDHWAALATFTETQWQPLQDAVRAKVGQDTGILCTVYRGREPFMTGARKRLHSFQVMPDCGAPERHPFWGWHVDSNPQWFASPGHAADSWAACFRFWRRFRRDHAAGPDAVRPAKIPQPG